MLEKILLTALLPIFSIITYVIYKWYDRKIKIKSLYTKLKYYVYIDLGNVYSKDVNNCFSGIIDIREKIEEIYLCILENSRNKGNLYKKTFKIKEIWNDYYDNYRNICMRGMIDKKSTVDVGILFIENCIKYQKELNSIHKIKNNSLNKCI